MTIKITSLKVHVIQSPLETPFAFSQGWVNKRSATIVEVETNDGITGWGEAFCQGLEPPQISAAVIENSLKDLIINENPLDINAGLRLANVLNEKGENKSAIALIDQFIDQKEGSISVMLMKLKLSLSTQTPAELSFYLDEILTKVKDEQS